LSLGHARHNNALDRDAPGGHTDIHAELATAKHDESPDDKM